ncbi:MAG: hypothetical protein WC455_13860 [Dehalococcoidia bacterium]|jgi:hypothetical protein
MKPKWEDATSYSRGEDHGKPRSWSIDIGPLRLVVVSEHIYHPGEWVMLLAPFYDAYELHVETAEEARKKALCLAYRKIAECYRAVCNLTGTS